MSDFDFDLAVVGSGPGGHHAAIQGAKLSKRVIMIKRKALVGGICINIGTIPSKTMREAILYLSGYRDTRSTAPPTASGGCPIMKR
jgi:NAD(P) transhydrogenase